MTCPDTGHHRFPITGWGWPLLTVNHRLSRYRESGGDDDGDGHTNLEIWIPMAHAAEGLRKQPLYSSGQHFVLPLFLPKGKG